MTDLKEEAMWDNKETSSLSAREKQNRKWSCKHIIIITIISFLVLFLILFLFAYILIDKNSQKDSICLTKHCVTLAAKMIESLDPSVDPCENFYNFACGGWIERNPIPEDKAAYSTFNELTTVMMRNLKTILDKIDENTSIVDERTMKIFYMSCMGMEQINKLGDKPLKDLLKKIGGAPIFDPTWKEEEFNLTTLLIKTNSVTSPLFKVYVVHDDSNSDRRIIRMEQGSVANLKAMFSDPQFDKQQEAFYKFLCDMVRLMNPSAPNNTITEAVDQVFDFAKKLTNVALKEEARRSTRSNTIKTLGELHDLLKDAFDFRRYIKEIFAPLEINDDEKISIKTQEYIEMLPRILVNTSFKNQANFFGFHVVRAAMEFLSQRFIDVKNTYNKVMTGNTADLPRWQMCVNMANDHMGETLGRLYVAKHFDKRAKKKALSMSQNIKEVFLEILDEAEWMQESTKVVAKEKVMSMREDIGYPEYIFNTTYLAEEYKNFNFTKDTFFTNFLLFIEIAEKKNLNSLRTPFDKTKWNMAPAFVNAYYSPNNNKLTFPAGILQSPFYHEESPMAINYGGVGMALGHELTHGFDDRGSMYDKDGNLKNWWPESDRNKFLELTSCVVNQYNKFPFDGINNTLNGNLTQGENIADNGGLKESFRAYEKWLKQYGPEPTLPGLPYNNKQLFYLSFGQMWCSLNRPEHALQIHTSSKHPPGKIRVTGSLVNSKSFSEVFNCPLGSKMNPVEKCSVW